MYSSRDLGKEKVSEIENILGEGRITVTAPNGEDDDLRCEEESWPCGCSWTVVHVLNGPISSSNYSPCKRHEELI